MNVYSVKFTPSIEVAKHPLLVCIKANSDRTMLKKLALRYGYLFHQTETIIEWNILSNPDEVSNTKSFKNDLVPQRVVRDCQIFIGDSHIPYYTIKHVMGIANVLRSFLNVPGLISDGFLSEHKKMRIVTDTSTLREEQLNKINQMTKKEKIEKTTDMNYYEVVFTTYLSKDRETVYIKGKSVKIMLKKLAEKYGILFNPKEVEVEWKSIPEELMKENKDYVPETVTRKKVKYELQLENGNTSFCEYIIGDSTRSALIKMIGKKIFGEKLLEVSNKLTIKAMEGEAF